MDGQQKEAKVREIGLDTILYSTPPQLNQLRSVPRCKIRYIAFENGHTYFVPTTKLYLISGKIILAQVRTSNDTTLVYQDLYTDRIKTLPTKKIAAIGYADGTSKYYVDKVNLRNGGYLAAHVLEVSETAIVLENLARKRKKQTIEREEVYSIEFKNGFEQQFSSTHLSSDSDQDTNEN